MKDQKCENNINQNMDQLEPKPQSPNKIKEPEKLMREGKSLQNKKENNKIKDKLVESRMINDDVEHPEPLLSDYDEETTEEIKKNFYENKKKENILIIEKKKNLKANNIQIMEQKLKAEHDSILLKENIGKVVLNSKFMNEKDLKKNKAQKCNLIIKPEQVVNNFMLETTSNINKLNDCEIINGNKKNKIIKKNNSYQCVPSPKNKKLIKHNNKNMSQQQIGTIVKIPINLNVNDKQKIKQINKISQPIPQLKINIQNKFDYIQNNNKLIKQASKKSAINKIPKKKIIKITPMSNISSIKNKKNRRPQTTLKNTESNYIQKIHYNQNGIINQQNKNNNILNKIVIKNNYDTLNKSISRDRNRINLSFENPINIVKMISPAKLENSIRSSNEIILNNQPKEEIKRIPIPFKVNNKANNMNYYTISKEKNKFSSEVNSSIKKDSKMNSTYKINDSYIDSDKENYSNNLKCDKCNKKTIERGGLFNNISTTFVVIRNSKAKLKYPEPSLTIDIQNFTKNKMLIPNSSTISVQHSPLNSTFQKNSIYTQKVNRAKAIKMYKSQNYLLNGKKNNSFSCQNSSRNFCNINYTNYSLYGRNYENVINSKNVYYAKNKEMHRPVIYNNNFGNNLWPDESYFSYFNTNGYNY